MADDKPIIIIKKKGGHGGHHGGAWKVAYADFVTAMMAFFMVMWLVNTAEQNTKQNIASYFRRPGLFQSGSGTPLMIGEAGILPDAFVPPHKADTKKQGGKDQDQNLPKNTGTEEKSEVKKKITIKGEQGKEGGQKDAAGNKGLLKEAETEQGKLAEKDGASLAIQKMQRDEKDLMGRIAEEIKQQIASSKELQELLGIVDVKIEADGLNIEIMDTEKSSMFASGSPRIQAEAKAAFKKLAGIIKKLPNSIDIVGHTDAKPFSSRTGAYSNWELSSDRAHAARRLLEEEGIPSNRITNVVGRADKEPKLPQTPLAAANRRITLKMRFKFAKNIDLAKNPTALDAPNKIAPAPVIESPIVPSLPLNNSTDTSNNSNTNNPEEKVHSLTAKQVTTGGMEAYAPKKRVSAKEANDRITLPESPADNDGSSPPPKNTIFGDSPVIGSDNIFSGF